jgi:hypothetical protein
MYASVLALVSLALFNSVNASSLYASNVPRELMRRAPHALIPRTLRVPYMGESLLDKRQATCGVGQDDCPDGGCCDGACW